MEWNKRVKESNLEEGVSDGFIEGRIANRSDPLVNKVDNTRFAGHDEVLVLGWRFDAVISHQFCNELMDRYDHDLSQ